MATTFAQNGSVYGGDDLDVEVTVYDAMDIIVSLTGHVMTFRLAKWPVGPTVLQKISSTAGHFDTTGFPNGIAVAKLTDTDTVALEPGPYAWQMMDRDTGNIDTVIAAGRLQVLARLPAFV